ncbi:hypothetical protein ACXC9Q_08570 [Kribbella sp. CWNU-51]
MPLLAGCWRALLGARNWTLSAAVVARQTPIPPPARSGAGTLTRQASVHRGTALLVLMRRRVD